MDRKRGEKRRNNHVTVESRGLLVETVDRLLKDERHLTSITFGHDICPFLLRDDFMETLVQILQSSTHLRRLGFYIGKKCKRFTLDGTSIMAEYIRTSPTLKVLSLEGDETASLKTNCLINASAWNPDIKELKLYSTRINQTSSLQTSSWEKLSFYDCAFEHDGMGDGGKVSVESLKIGHRCAPSLITWLLPRLTILGELDIALETFPQTMVSCLSKILATSNSLKRLHFHVGYSSDSHIRVCRHLNSFIYDQDDEYLDATTEQLLKILESLAHNSSLQHLSLSLPTSAYQKHQRNERAIASLKLHIQRNLNLVSLGILSCPSLTPSQKVELKKIQIDNQTFLNQVETGVDDCPPKLWPFLIERCLKAKSTRGLDAVFLRLSDNRIAPL